MVDDDAAPLTTTCWVLPIRKVSIHVAIDPEIYIYNSVLTCRQHIIYINSSASAPPNATKIAVKKGSDVVVCMFGPELKFRCINVVFWRVFARDSAPGG